MKIELLNSVPQHLEDAVAKGVCHESEPLSDWLDFIYKDYDPFILLLSFGAEEMVVILSFEWEAKKKGLVVLGLGGKGLFKNYAEILSFIKALAERYECSYIGGLAQRRGLERLYEKNGAKKMFAYYKTYV